MTHTSPPTQNDLAAGRELDAEVATKVFGLKPFEVDGWWQYIPSGKPRRTHMIDAQTLPAFSTDIRAAWQIVEHIDSLGWKVQVQSNSRLEGYEADGPWVCVFNSRDGAPWASADTAPLAICAAALKVVGAL